MVALQGIAGRSYDGSSRERLHGTHHGRARRKKRGRSFELRLRMARYLLAFDIGATSGRAIRGCLDGGALSISEVHRFPNEPLSANGSLRWNVAALWAEMQAALAAHGAGLDSIGVDTWGVDYALLGKDGE